VAAQRPSIGALRRPFRTKGARPPEAFRGDCSSPSKRNAL